jgi:histidyl-tRNA synthetase
MFRHEQPQYGRYRQFYQLGVEVFGLEGPDIDAEQVAMFANLWRRLGIDPSTVVEVNSLGSVNDREVFKRDLVEYFSKYKDKLDEDCKKRLYKNPLRILDSKNPELQDLIQGAPALSTYINGKDKQHFDKFLARLIDLKVPYQVNPRLIRGLDYYNRTVYEWVTTKLGAQSAIGAGGRYDGLAEQLGGPTTPAVGFAMGLERVLLLMQQCGVNINKTIDGYLICAGEAAIDKSLSIAEHIRAICPWLALAMNYDGGSFKSQFKKADKSGARLALIVGDDELAKKTITIKFLREEREQETVALTELQKFLGGYCGSISN